MAGRKPDLNSNVHYLPGSGQVTSQQMAEAAELKPEMPASAGAVWDRLAPEMMSLNRLKPHFVDAFAEYCYLLARIAETRKFLIENGETYVAETRNGRQIKSRPEVAQLNDDWRKLARLTSCFGLTPSDEKSLVSSIQSNLVDEFAEFK
jgi:P27 family predicted phage terminase small subunit